jgi:hypothetical protein
MRIVFAVLRVAAAAAIVAAVVGQFAKSLSMVPDPGFFVVNFFSFFTIQSNLIGAVVLAIGAVLAFGGRDDSARFALVRACATAYLATTLVVYNTLLRDISLDQATTLPWSNEILHVWAPLYVVVDWVLAPGRRTIAWRRLWAVAIYPLAWAAYTMLRGAIVGWYPYPFLNPDVAPGVGYDGVAVYVVAIAAFILLVGAGVIAVSRTSWPYRAAAAAPEPVGSDAAARTTA